MYLFQLCNHLHTNNHVVKSLFLTGTLIVQILCVYIYIYSKKLNNNKHNSNSNHNHNSNNDNHIN